jgi:hypothetical protein
MSKPSLYIACGGSGLKSIRSLTELISQDPDLRKSFNNDIYFVLIDTEKEELDSTERYIKSLIPFADEEHIVKIQTSTGAISLEPLVREALDPSRHLQRPEGEKGLNRLKSHWWVREDNGLPFVARGVSPLDTGAGQCPPVSYFLAWRMMGEIQKKLEGLFHEIIESRGGDIDDSGKKTSPLDGFNYTIISGVAGGTGRGCWELIAFKIREVCTKKFKAAPTPRVILFDATVTQSIMSDQAQRIGTKVNSLTAYSQLECWSKIKTEMKQSKTIDAGFKYRLPSMTSPENEHGDVLSVEGQSGQQTPIDQAFLIFENSSVAVLDSSNDYYLMAGRALYAQLKFQAVGSQAINSDHFYNSLGSATFEVPAIDLLRYFESGARIEYLKGLQSKDDVLVAKSIESFLQECRLDHLFTNKDLKAMLPAPDPKDDTLWQKIVRGIHELKQGDWDNLASHLKDSGSDLEELMDELNGYSKISEEDAKTIAKEVFRGLGDFSERAKNILQKLYQPDNDSVSRSIGNLKAFSDLLKEKCLSDKTGNEGFLNQFPKKIAPDWTKPEDLFEAYKGRKHFGIAGERFEDAEITEIQGAALKWIVVKNYETIKEAYIATAREYLLPLDSIVKNAGVLADRVELLLADEESKLIRSVEVEHIKDVHKKYFRDPKNPIIEGGRRRFVQRQLKPVLEQEHFAEMCCSKDAVSVRDDNKLKQICFDGLFNGSLDEDKVALGKKLQAEIASSISINPGFIVANFSLEKTVEGLRKAWQEYLGNTTGTDDYHIRCEQFASVFGYKPPQPNSLGEVDMGTLEEMLHHMVSSLAASTSAFWELETSIPKERKVHVFIPNFPSLQLSEKKGDFVDRIKQELPGFTGVEVFVGGKGTSANPFAIVALHHESAETGPDQIRSMQYWSEQGVIDQLQMCERPGTENAIFNPANGMNGVTFSDPIYVNNHEFRKKRWKPWLKPEDEKMILEKLDAIAPSAESAEQKSIQALLYLFLKPDGEIGKQAADLQWSLPLAELKTTGTVRFTRNGIVWRDGKVRQDSNSAIKEGEEIGKMRSGVSGLKKWLGSPEGAEALQGILSERNAFWVMLEEAGGWTRKSAKGKIYAELCDGLEVTLSGLRKVASVNDEEAENTVWKELIKASQDRNESLI